MPVYRNYFLDEGANISRPPVVLECSNNEEAINKTRQYIDGKYIELW